MVDRNGNQIKKATLELDSYGAFETDLELGQSFRLGQYNIQIKSVDDQTLANHVIRLEDFVPLTIEPKLQTNNEIWSLNSSQKIQLSGASSKHRIKLENEPTNISLDPNLLVLMNNSIKKIEIK